MNAIRLYGYFRGLSSSPRTIPVRDDFHKTCKKCEKPDNWVRMLEVSGILPIHLDLWVCARKKDDLFLYIPRMEDEIDSDLLGLSGDTEGVLSDGGEDDGIHGLQGRFERLLGERDSGQLLRESASED